MSEIYWNDADSAHALPPASFLLRFLVPVSRTPLVAGALQSTIASLRSERVDATEDFQLAWIVSLVERGAPIAGTLEASPQCPDAVVSLFGFDPTRLSNTLVQIAQLVNCSITVLAPLNLKAPSSTLLPDSTEYPVALSLPLQTPSLPSYAFHLLNTGPAQPTIPTKFFSPRPSRSSRQLRNLGSFLLRTTGPPVAESCFLQQCTSLPVPTCDAGCVVSEEEDVGTNCRASRRASRRAEDGNESGLSAACAARPPCTKPEPAPSSLMGYSDNEEDHDSNDEDCLREANNKENNVTDPSDVVHSNKDSSADHNEYTISRASVLYSKTSTAAGVKKQESNSNRDSSGHPASPSSCSMLTSLPPLPDGSIHQSKPRYVVSSPAVPSLLRSAAPAADHFEFRFVPDRGLRTAAARRRVEEMLSAVGAATGARVRLFREVNTRKRGVEISGRRAAVEAAIARVQTGYADACLVERQGSSDEGGRGRGRGAATVIYKE